MGNLEADKLILTDDESKARRVCEKSLQSLVVWVGSCGEGGKMGLKDRWYEFQIPFRFYIQILNFKKKIIEQFSYLFLNYKLYIVLILHIYLFVSNATI